MLHFIGPRIFNKIVELKFYRSCNTKVGFKTNMKKYLIDNWFSTFLIFLLDFQSLIGNITYAPYLGKSCCFDILCRVLSRFCFFSMSLYHFNFSFVLYSIQVGSRLALARDHILHVIMVRLDFMWNNKKKRFQIRDRSFTLTGVEEIRGW